MSKSKSQTKVTLFCLFVLVIMDLTHRWLQLTLVSWI
ncbi:unnamed protein product [Schistosoma curassoni]|uniref:Signal peptidase II n=1 Tax=Schistosoma curassoni TaxID=6186 RepID=A0A183JUZ4_9TREM|nr:unnamed protein product [Schistosoma curassoni]